MDYPVIPAPRKSGNLLTPCQIEVLRHLRSGLRPAQVAARQQCALATVRMHIRMINARLGTRSYGASVLRAEQLGLLDMAETISI